MQYHTTLCATTWLLSRRVLRSLTASKLFYAVITFNKNILYFLPETQSDKYIIEINLYFFKIITFKSNLYVHQEGVWSASAVEPLSVKHCSWRWAVDIDKFKEVKCKWIFILCSAFLWTSHARHRSQFYLQITPFLPLPYKRSPECTTTGCSGRHLIVAYYRHGHGSTFWNPTQPNPPKYKPNPTQPTTCCTPTQPNPFPYILSRDYIVYHTVNFLVQSTHTISPQNINVGC